MWHQYLPFGIGLRGTWYFLHAVYHTLRFDFDILEPAYLNAALVHKVLSTQSTRSLRRRPSKDGRASAQ
jgi:hypothetical protein